MMSTSDRSYKEYSFAYHAKVYGILEKVCAAYDIHYYLIGANARDIALYKAGTKPNRGTADIDFAVMLPNMEGYKTFLKALTKLGFEDLPSEIRAKYPYRLKFTESNTVIDLLPYGQIAQNHTVSFDKRHVELSVIGMKEVGDMTETFLHPENLSVPVSPAHGIIILKLIAWSEKPERTKDLSDIASLLNVAWTLQEEELYTEGSAHADLFDMDNFDTDVVGARVIGRKIQDILESNIELKEQIETMLQKELNIDGGPISIALVEAMSRDLEFAKRIIHNIKEGLTENYKN